MYFYCMNSVKTKILPMLGTGYFLKIAKKKKQSVLIAKISLRKTQKNRQSAKINSRKSFVLHGNIVVALCSLFSPGIVYSRA